MSLTPQDAVTNALWERVCADFNSEKTHQAFLTHCRSTNSLDDAARRYREHKNTLNEDQVDEREAIDKRLGAIAIVAMTQLEERRARARPNNRATKILTLVAAVLAVASVIALAQALLGGF